MHVLVSRAALGAPGTKTVIATIFFSATGLQSRYIAVALAIHWGQEVHISMISEELIMI